MKWYVHAAIIISLILFTLFFYQDGYGSAIFLVTSVYLAFVFITEIKKAKKTKNKKID